MLFLHPTLLLCYSQILIKHLFQASIYPREIIVAKEFSKIKSNFIAISLNQLLIIAKKRQYYCQQRHQIICDGGDLIWFILMLTGEDFLKGGG